MPPTPEPPDPAPTRHEPNWRWRAEPVRGPAIVFDMDGVLSDASGRQHYLDGPFRDWEAFFAACGERPAFATSCLAIVPSASTSIR